MPINKTDFLYCFDNISNAVCVVNKNYEIEYANSRFIANYALHNQKIDKTIINDICPEELIQQLDYIFDNAEQENFETILVNDCELKSLLIDDEFKVIIIDKLIDKELANSKAELFETKEKFKASEEQAKYTTKQVRLFEDRLRLVLNNMPILFIAFDNKKNIVFWNYECQRVTGFVAQEIVNKQDGFKLVFAENDLYDLINKSQKEVFRNYESDIKCSDGSVRNILWSGLSKEYNITNWGNWIVGIDITEKLRQDRRILLESKINKSLANSSAELISPSLSIDKTARILIESSIELTGSEAGYVAFDDSMSDNILVHYFSDNKSSKIPSPSNFCFIPRSEYFDEGFYGYPLDQDTAKLENNIKLEVTRSIGKKSPKFIKNCLVQPAIANNMFVGQIVLINAPEGFSKRSADFVQSLANVYALAVFRKQMEWDLLNAKDKAEESDRLKTAFLANMSHEIRTPMNAIIGFSDLLTSKTISEEKKLEFNKIVNNSCEDLLMLVNDIIDISKIEAGQLKFHPTKVNLGALFNEIKQIGEQKIKVKEKEISIVYDNINDEEFELFIDGLRLKQILVNLIGNAIKFTEQGEINVGYHFNQENQVCFYVKDTGVGIAKNHQKEIFESFRQLETTISREHSGTGLGLAISKSIVEQMGGKLKLESTVDIGSTFSFLFPYSLKYSNSNKNIKAKKLEEESLYLDNKTILVVDDEPKNSKLINVFLDDTNATIVNAQSGIEAISLVEQQKPDLVLMDIRMPEMDGIEATQIIMNMYNDIPVIAQTAYAMKEDEEKCMQAGFKGYLSKPIKKKDLFHKIKEALVIT